MAIAEKIYGYGKNCGNLIAVDIADFLSVGILANHRLISGNNFGQERFPIFESLTVINAYVVKLGVCVPLLLIRVWKNVLKTGLTMVLFQSYSINLSWMPSVHLIYILVQIEETALVQVL